MGSNGAVLLKNAHVIDPAQGIDRIADVAIIDGKIASVGDAGAVPADAQVIDLSGQYLTPGWIDIHVHAYGTLGFVDFDSIGIYQGVTSMVDAGGPGVRTLDDFVALSEGRIVTSLYAGPHILPSGIVGLDYFETEEDCRSIDNISPDEWLDWVEAHPGVVRFVKAGAYSHRGAAQVDAAKRVAERLGVPLYVHIGENHVWPDLVYPLEHAFRAAQKGDIITHIFHGAPVGRIVDKAGKVLPFVKEAQARGVLFDIGFGSYGFSWDVAETALAQGIRPHFISSDLQQFNVLNPVFSLANVMSICLRLGLPLGEVVAGVTASPARALSLADRAGSLRAGQPADITVFRLERGTFELVDCVTQKRTADTKIVPVMAFKNGHRIECDLMRAQDERNWFMQIADDHIPDAAARFSPQQLAFLASFRAALGGIEWDGPQKMTLATATAVHDAFNQARRANGISMYDAMTAVYACFLDHRFPMQIGLFMVRLERPFALARLDEIVGRHAMAAE